MGILQVVNEVHDVDNINPTEKEGCENTEGVRKIEMGRGGDGHGDDFKFYTLERV